MTGHGYCVQQTIERQTYKRQVDIHEKTKDRQVDNTLKRQLDKTNKRMLDIMRILIDTGEKGHT